MSRLDEHGNCSGCGPEGCTTPQEHALAENEKLQPKIAAMQPVYDAALRIIGPISIYRGNAGVPLADLLTDSYGKLEDSMNDFRIELMHATHRCAELQTEVNNLTVQLSDAHAAFAQKSYPSESCAVERADGNGGCGACSICCNEQRERADVAEARLSKLNKE